jgi:hypothetical protein
MLKPSPDMSEEDGIEEAIETIKYLFDLSKKYSCEVIVYLNPVYVAKGSPLALEFAKKNYNPPKIESVLKVIVKTKKFTNLNIYTGLWSENNAESNGDFTYRKDFKLDIKEAIKKFNKTQNFDILLPFLINQ